MTNEDYLQWEPLVNKVAYKYRNNIYKIELEDLIQIGAVGLIYAFENYEECKGTQFKTYAYNCIERKILREFQNMNRIKRQSNYKSISFDTPINTNEDLYLNEVIGDDKVNVEVEVIEKLMIEKYKEEISTVLVGKEKDIVYRTLFEKTKVKDLANEYGMDISKVNTILNKGFRNLRHKSPMIRNRWLKMQEEELENRFINTYNNTENVYFHFQINSYLLKKYKKQITILNFIQELFDSFSYEFKFEKYTGFILGLDIFNKRDLELFDKHKINKISKEQLLKQGYEYIEILNIENVIKKTILRNKSYIYEKWIEFNKKKAIAI